MAVFFSDRHLGVTDAETQEMLQTLGASSLDEVIDLAIPASIRTTLPDHFPSQQSEEAFLAHIAEVAKQNQLYTDFIGRGYYPAQTPSVIKRNILENPGWYTQYTPYQAEISQGRLEVLFYFQSIICELTKLPIANASLLDEATATAEAMLMMHALHQQKPNAKKEKSVFLVDSFIFPQTKKVLRTKAKALQIEIEEGNVHEKDIANYEGVFVQYPNSEGAIVDYRSLIEKCKTADVAVCMIADILSLTLLTPPGEMGASIVVGSTQRLGIPMGFGGPYAAYLSCEEKYKRVMPGRIIGKTIDVHGNPCFRMALQTREQHIKREKATSNICTAQSLLAIMATMYVIYHGKKGLVNIAHSIASRTHYLAKCLEALPDEAQVLHTAYFDTLKIKIGNPEGVKQRLEKQKINVYYYADGVHIGVSLNETTSLDDIHNLLSCIIPSFEAKKYPYSASQTSIPDNAKRADAFLEDEVFNYYTNETKLMRFIFSLQEKDLSLTKSIIPLGSCTMKLNAATSLMPLSMAEFANIHPLAPHTQTKGYTFILESLEKQLSIITEMDACSLQPNSGAQGEYAGLLCIKNYFDSIHESQRNIILIPISAHGTNPASAKIAGFDIVAINCTPQGEIDIAHLQQVVAECSNRLAGLMVTYPSTYGIFDKNIAEVSSIIHQHGGQVYMDGANMNAQVGLTSPAKIGADVCHLNLHKTFSIPHGGGGPGVGPICVKKHLIPFLPAKENFLETSTHKTAVSAAPYGSASICIISYAYIFMMGKEGLTNATKYAILNANYMKARLENTYPILYTNENGYCAHEFILDFRAFKQQAHIEVEDVAKRLMDYGFHAPTVSFPVASTLMVEPTESEDKRELDRLCDALISIREEIKAVENGTLPQDNNPLKNAPHSFELLCKNEWTYPYSREMAAFPLDFVRKKKFWIPIGRVNQAYGDRNLICSCAPIESYVKA